MFCKYNVNIVLRFIVILLSLILLHCICSSQKYGETDITKLNYHTYCKFQPSRQRCGKSRSSNRYYYDLKLQDCQRFEYGNCNNSFNMFRSKKECRTSCIDAALSPTIKNSTGNVYCRFQPDFGDCNSYHPMWYYDLTEMKCRGFSYSGCGGNANRFHTSKACAAICLQSRIK